jgi:hypothetical protein
MGMNSVKIERAGDNTFTFRVSGLLHKHEMERAQSVVAAEVERGGTVKLLIVLEKFEGWERGADWGDMRFYETHGKQIERIAIVGEGKWRDEALMFTGAGLRKTPVQYFEPHEADRARAWLSQG